MAIQPRRSSWKGRFDMSASVIPAILSSVAGPVIGRVLGGGKSDTGKAQARARAAADTEAKRREAEAAQVRQEEARKRKVKLEARRPTQTVVTGGQGLKLGD
jgi:hypothetical protein